MEGLRGRRKCILTEGIYNFAEIDSELGKPDFLWQGKGERREKSGKKEPETLT